MTSAKIEKLFWATLCGVAVAFAAAMLIAYARDPDGLWRDALHDRNAYLSIAMTYAGAFRDLNLVKIIVHTAQSTVWPPFHGIILGFVLLPWMDYRLGPVMALTGWAMTVVISALIARRFFSEALPGMTAAALAAMFVIASPAFRLLGSDVMLEGLGAGLSALSLLLYLRAMERPDDARRWRWLGLALTFLFFEKYNYWAMLVASLAVGFAAEQPRRVMSTLHGWHVAIDRRRLLIAAARDPLLIAGAITLALLTLIYVLKPQPIQVFGTRVGLYPPENLTTLAYAFFFVRLAIAWRRHRQAFERHVGPVLRMLAYWHAAPIMISFLIPKRISAFIWFLGPSNSSGGMGSHPLQSALSQWPGFAEGFHVATWSAVLVIGLAIVAGAKLMRLPCGARTIALFPLICACALLSHPQQQWRFEATWLFGVWISAGIGGAIVLEYVTRRLPRLVQIAGSAAAIAALAIALAAQPVSSIAAVAAIRTEVGPSDLAFARAYLPHIKGTHPVGFLTSFGRSEFLNWTVRQDCGCGREVDAPFNGQTADEARAFAEAWILRTRAEKIVVIDAPGVHEMPQIGTTAAVRRGALDVMRAQTRFRRVADVPVSAFGAIVTIWQRD